MSISYKEWTQLLDYFFACLEREDLFRQQIPRGGESKKFLVNLTEQDYLVSGGNVETTLEASHQLRDFLETKQQQGRVLYYGYPCVFSIEEQIQKSERIVRKRMLYPLFYIPVTVVPDKADYIMRADEPENSLNAAALRGQGLKEENLDELGRLLDERRAELDGESRDSVFNEQLLLITEYADLQVQEPIIPHALPHRNLQNLAVPGVYNISMLFAGARTAYYEALLEELQELKDHRWYDKSQHTAAGALFGVNTPLLTDSPEWLATPVEANEAQLDAIHAAFTQRLTLVTGPPGTGKSQLILNLLTNVFLHGKTALLASTNNAAVDVVSSRFRDLESDLLVRTGKSDERKLSRESIRQQIERANSRVPDVQLSTQTITDTWKQLQNVVTSVDRRCALDAELEAAVDEKANALTNLPARAQEGIRELRDVDPSYFRYRLEHLERLVSRFRAGQFTFMERLVGMFVRDYAWRHGQRQYDKFLAMLPNNLQALCHPRLKTTDTSIDQWDFLRAVIRAIEAYKRVEELRQRDRQMAPYEQLASQLEIAKTAHILSSRQLLKAREETRQRKAKVSRAAILRYLDAADELSIWHPADIRYKYEEDVRQTFSGMLDHFPLWATTSLSAKRALPLHGGMYDFVIIDEASQCDIPSALPILIRAKHAIIIGDPRQLTHVCTVSQRLDWVLSRKTGFSSSHLYPSRFRYSDKSIYQCAVVALERPPILLDEHFRSHQDIINLSNALFYRGRLVILTDPTKLLSCFGPTEPAIRWVDTRGQVVRPPGGSAYNEIEAKRVADEVTHMVDQLHNETFTLGVVTPFSRQQHLINEYLQSRIEPSVWESTKLIAATAHKFQGDERDIMIFSPVVSEGIKAGTLYWLAETPNLFNVAISRARSLLIIVGNLAYCLQSNGLLKQMAEYVHHLSIEAELRRAEAESLLASLAEKRLYQGLLQRGVKVTPKWRAGPYETDFAYMDGDFHLDIECDGAAYHLEAGRQRRQDMVRDARIRQLGWEVLRLPAWKIFDDLSDCLNQIEDFISRKRPAIHSISNLPHADD